MGEWTNERMGCGREPAERPARRAGKMRSPPLVRPFVRPGVSNPCGENAHALERPFRLPGSHSCSWDASLRLMPRRRDQQFSSLAADPRGHLRSAASLRVRQSSGWYRWDCGSPAHCPARGTATPPPDIDITVRHLYPALPDSIRLRFVAFVRARRPRMSSCFPKLEPALSVARGLYGDNANVRCAAFIISAP